MPHHQEAAPCCISCGSPFRSTDKSLGTYTSDLLDNLSRSNPPISEQNARGLRDDIIPNSVEALAAVEQELDRLEALRTAILAECAPLEKAKARLSGMVSRSRELLSPLWQLPVECMTEIFQWCCLNEPVSVFDLNGNAWRLMQVCCYWRDIAMSNPSLWSSIYLHGTYPKNWKVTLSAHLEQSRSHPISFFLDFGVGFEDTHAQNYEDCLRILMYHSQRWEHAKFRLDITSLRILSAVSSIGSSLQLLRSLAFHSYCGPTIGDMFLSAPLLQAVTFMYCDGAGLGLPLGQLTTVVIVVLQAETMEKEAFRFLSSCPSLRSLTVGRVGGGWYGSDIQHEHSTFSSPVRYLEVQSLEWSFWTDFRSPFLEELRCGISGDIQRLSTFIQNSCCQKLKRLAIHGASHHLRFDDLLGLLDMAPRLEEVELHRHVPAFQRPHSAQEQSFSECFNRLVDDLDIAVLRDRAPALRKLKISLDEGKKPGVLHREVVVRA